jgi:hypothetical protein
LEFATVTRINDDLAVGVDGDGDGREEAAHRDARIDERDACAVHEA